jgi:hypothetical protein
MRYAQIVAGNKLHLVYEAGEGKNRDSLVPAGHMSAPLCNSHFYNGKFRMTINVPLAHACKNCLRIYSLRHGAI